ncbi:MAG: MFS transporter [Alphaproteobacteria bacterium]|nr:MFS transporter [Alphaproteobacteria bacterium]
MARPFQVEKNKRPRLNQSTITQDTVTERPLFRIPDYRRGWLLGILAGVVRWLEFLALGIFAYQLTSSPPLVALLAIVRVAPYAFLGFAVGALTDRFDRRLLFIISLSVMISVSAAMTYLSYTGQMTYPLILATTLATGIFWLTDMPIRRRFMIDAVGPARIGRAMGIDNITNYVTRGFGPLAGGVVFQWFGATGIFTLNFCLYVVCLLLVLGLPRPVGTTTAADGDGDQQRAPRLTSLALLRNARFMIILGITIIYNVFCAPFVAMIPVFAQKDFGFSPAAVGTLASVEGLGGVIGSLLIGIYIRQQYLFPVYFFGPALYLCALLALSYSLTASATFAGLIVASFGGGCFSGTQYALIYTTAPPELRGRAFGFLALGIGCATLGLWNAGFLFKYYDSAIALRIMALEGLIPLSILGLLAFILRPPRSTAG